MNPAACLINDLRAAGVSLRVEQSDLLVEAPAGFITAELRDKLMRHKVELITLLESESVAGDDLQEIAALLATAYRRLKSIRYVGKDGAENSDARALAEYADKSVHGVVP